jgi:hypothetical protein
VVRRPCPRLSGPGRTPFLPKVKGVVIDNLAPARVGHPSRGYPCLNVPTVAPGPTLSEERTHRWGHIFCTVPGGQLASRGVFEGSPSIRGQRASRFKPRLMVQIPSSMGPVPLPLVVRFFLFYSRLQPPRH